MDLVLGSENGTVLGVGNRRGCELHCVCLGSAPPPPPCKADASFQWSNYCHSEVPAGKKVLRVNIDETSVCLFQRGRGTVFLAKRSPMAVQSASLNQQRTYLSHVAMICDDPVIQRVLPQVIIANEHTMTAGQYATLRGECPAPCRLLRRKSAWVDIPLFAQIIGWLAAALAPFLGAYPPIVYFDAHKVHLSPSIFRACARGKLWAIVVAASTTWLMQPLDTHAFAPYKCCLRKAYQRNRIQSAGGAIGVGMLLASIYTAIKDVLEARDWASAFDRDGFAPAQVGISPRVLEHLGAALPLGVPSTRPTLEQLRRCWPRRQLVPVADVWRRSPPPPAPVPVLRRSARLAGAASSSASGSSMVPVVVAVPVPRCPRKRPASAL